MWTWGRNDFSQDLPFAGDFVKALKPCKAGAMILPGSADIEFPPEDSESEAKHMPNAARCRPCGAKCAVQSRGPGRDRQRAEGAGVTGAPYSSAVAEARK